MLLAVIVLAAAFVPAPAHAGWFDWVPSASELIAEGVLAIFVALNTLLGQALVAVQNALLWILTLKITAGVTVVGFAWSIIRDLVNMAFIVIFIIISFATIFNVTGFLKQYYWKQALVPLVIGAIVLNYSLAIGQAVSLLSNRIAAIAVGLLPNPGQVLIESLQPHTLTMQTQYSVGAPQTKITDVRKELTEAEQAHLKKCLNEEKVVSSDAGNSTAEFIARSLFLGGYGNYTTTKVRKSVADCNLEIIEARNAVAKKGAGEELSDSERKAVDSSQAAFATFKGTTNQKTLLIGQAAFNAFMLILIIACLAVAFAFLAVRIMVIWTMLAIAPLAWLSYAVPGGWVPFNTWWKNFIAWNVFGPMYIFMLIPGMHILIGQGELLTALSRSGASPGEGLVQLLLFQAFAVMIFVGGLGLALKSSFAASVKGTAFAGAALQKVGAFDAMVGMGAVRQIGQRTGITPRLQAGWEKTKQDVGDRAAAARARMGVFGRTQEESLAAARARVGVRGGAEEVESLRAKRVTSEKTKLEQSMKIARAKAEADGEPFDEADWLEDYKDSTNPDIRLAAREMLTSRGKISTDDMIETAEEYAKVSPLARQSYVERASSRLTEKAGKKGPEGFKDASEAIAALDSGLLTDKQKTVFLGTLQRNQPLVAAEIAMDPNQKHIPGKNAAQIITENFSGMSNTDIAKLLQRGATNSQWLGAVGTPDRDRIQGSLKARLKRAGAPTEHYYEIVAAAPGQQKQLDYLIK
jgi:hypothetical protein